MKIKLLVIIILFLNACSGFNEAGKVLRNEKIKTTDEFLVKKRDALVLPPDFEEIPEPGSQSKNLESSDEKKKIKEIFTIIDEENIGEKKTSSVEDSILNKINK